MPLRPAAAILSALLSTSALAQSPEGAVPATPADPVAVTRVTLATGGLAHVEGRMTAPSETMRLAIERPQVADVLRTLVISGSSPVVSIDLPAAEPVGERSQTGRLLAGDLADPQTLLSELIGEDVVLRGGADQLQGRLLAFSFVEIPEARRGEEPVPSRPAVRVSVATPDGRVAFATFPTVDQLQIEGEAVAARLAGVIPALAESVDDSRRELTVRLAEPGEAGFSFVVPTTVWRPSYRAVIGEAGEVALQGWGTLENTSGLDWNGIDLRLAVGTPVAYAQDVYSPLRSSRPDAPFAVGRTVETDIVPGMASGPEYAAAPAPSIAMAEAGAADTMRQRFAAAPARMAKPAAVVTGEAATAGTASTIFNVAGKIDLAAGRTLTVPFLSGQETANRITYLDLAAGRQPMDALELTFDAAATVPGGLIAVYDEAGFIGDARFGGADGGETTILPFAVTADVSATTTDDTRTFFATARLAGGGLQLTRSEVTRTAIRVEASTPTTLVADVSRDAAAEVTASAGEGVEVAVTTLDGATARLRAALPAGTRTVLVTRTRPISEYYSVSNIPTPVIEEVLAAGGSVDEATKARLREIGAITSRISEIAGRIAILEADIADMREAVSNDRENLEAIDVRTPEGAAVRRRIIERTDRIDAALTELQQLRREQEAEQVRLRG